MVKIFNKWCFYYSLRIGNIHIGLILAVLCFTEMLMFLSKISPLEPKGGDAFSIFSQLLRTLFLGIFAGYVLFGTLARQSDYLKWAAIGVLITATTNFILWMRYGLFLQYHELFRSVYTTTNFIFCIIYLFGSFYFAPIMWSYSVELEEENTNG